MKEERAIPNRRKILRQLSTLSLAAGAASLGLPKLAAAQAPTIRIAYLAPLTGRLESYGKLQQAAVQLALKEINDAGGVNGAAIELITEDTAFNPQQAVEKVRKVIERDRVFAVLGPYGSGEMDVVAPLAVRLQAPMVSTVFTKIGVPKANRPWVFRIGPNDGQVIEFACAQYRKLFPNAKRVAMIGNAAEPYVAATLRDYLPAGFRRHGFELVETVEITTAQIDYAGAVNRLARIPADIYFVQAIAGELVSIAREIARQDLAAKSIVAGLQGPWAGPWLRLNQEALDKWYAVGFFNHASDRKEVRGFLAKLSQAYGDATARSISVEASAYDTLHILADSMRNAKITPATGLAEARAQIRDGLARLKNYHGVSGTLSMNADGDSEGIQFSVFRAQKGNWVAV